MEPVSPALGDLMTGTTRGGRREERNSRAGIADGYPLEKKKKKIHGWDTENELSGQG